MTRTSKVVGTMMAMVCLLALLSAERLSAADADAEKVYLDKCSVCHGPDGAGKTAKGKKLSVKDVHSPDVQKMTEAQFAEIIAKGKGKDMDGFEKELGKDTCQKLATYMKDLAKK